jgi:hypothetical protein
MSLELLNSELIPGFLYYCFFKYVFFQMCFEYSRNLCFPFLLSFLLIASKEEKIL